MLKKFSLINNLKNTDQNLLQNDKTSIVLNNSSALDERRVLFEAHNEKFMPVLDEIVSSKIGTETRNTLLNCCFPTQIREANAKIFNDTVSNSDISTNSFEKWTEIQAKLPVYNCDVFKHKIKSNSELFLECQRVSVKHIDDISGIPDFNEIVVRCANYFQRLLSEVDLNFLLKLTIHNEKFALALLFPYVYTTLGIRLGTLILYCMHGGANFIKFMTIVVQKISTKTLEVAFITINSGKAFRFIGITGSVITLFKYSFILGASNSALIKSTPGLYTGFSGSFGLIFSEFRTLGSTFAYEIAKTASTITSAAFAGLIEPKTDIIKGLIDNIIKSVRKG